VLQDFASGESWPGPVRGAAGLAAAEGRERAVRARLEAEHPEIMSGPPSAKRPE
jgi:hypothetical protein